MTDMHSQTRLYRRNSVYYFRARIPRDLQPYLGKVEEKFSLRTSDPAQARRLARQASVDFDRRCQRVRDTIQSKQGDQSPLVIDDDLIKEICERWRHETLASDEYSRREGLFRDEFETHKEARQETREILMEALAQSLMSLPNFG